MPKKAKGQGGEKAEAKRRGEIKIHTGNTWQEKSAIEKKRLT